MSSDIKPLKVFLDTNVVKKINGPLIQFDLSETYYTLKRFIIGNGLENIKIFIPEMVIEELLVQYLKDFEEEKTKTDSLLEELLGCSQRVGMNLDIITNSELSVRDYKTLIRESATTFLEKEKDFLSVVKTCSENKLSRIVSRAIKKKKPFFGGKYRNKDFSDAGFKDVIILESIIECLEKEPSDFLICSKDNCLCEINIHEEFNGIRGWVESIDTGKGIAQFLSKMFGFDDLSEFGLFCRSDYFHEMIEASLEDCKLVCVDSIEKVDVEGQILLNVLCVITVGGNEKKYIVRLTETRDFVEILDLQNGEVVYEWGE